MAQRAPAERHPRRAGYRAHARTSGTTGGTETPGRCRPPPALAQPAGARSGRGAEGVRTGAGRCTVEHGPTGHLSAASPDGRSFAGRLDPFRLPGADVEPAHWRNERHRGAARRESAPWRHASHPSQPRGGSGACTGRPGLHRTARCREGWLRCRNARAPRHAWERHPRRTARGGGGSGCDAVVRPASQSRGGGSHAHRDARPAGFRCRRTRSHRPPTRRGRASASVDAR